MKKVFALLLVLSMVFALCACGKDTAPETTAAAILSEYCFSEVPINVSISSARRLSSPSVIIFICFLSCSVCNKKTPSVVIINLVMDRNIIPQRKAYFKR